MENYCAVYFGQVEQWQRQCDFVWTGWRKVPVCQLNLHLCHEFSADIWFVLRNNSRLLIYQCDRWREARRITHRNQTKGEFFWLFLVNLRLKILHLCCYFKCRSKTLSFLFSVKETFISILNHYGKLYDKSFAINKSSLEFQD